MKKLRPMFVTFAILAAVVAWTWDATGEAVAQGKGARKSPHETVSAKFGTKYVTVTYGRPYTKDPKSGEMRKIWGGLVPYGKAWRAGADEATTLITETAFMIGDKEIPIGVYTLYMIPMEKGPSKLVFGKKVGGWGIPVDTAQDFAQVDLKMEPLEPQLDQFTISLAPATKGGPGLIKLMWEKAQFSAEFVPSFKK